MPDQRALSGRKLITKPEIASAAPWKAAGDDTVMKALIGAHHWRRRIESGQAQSITDLAEQETFSGG